MDTWEKINSEAEGIFRMFSDDTPVSLRRIDTSRGDSDFRETIIFRTGTGGRYVIKLANNDFTFPEKIKVWQRTVREYLALGYYCPEIYCDRTGSFPTVEYSGRKCTAYAEEYSRFEPLENRASDSDAPDISVFNRYRKDIWAMTAKIAAKYLDYTEYPSGYCLFETFCPSDKTDEVLENALNWKEYAETLPDRFTEQVQRIWKLWSDNRAALEPFYKKLPASVFQADLNSTNILVDSSGKFVGIYDFNLCGRDVFLNYLMRENHGEDSDAEIGTICDMLRVSGEYYHFSEFEKDSALMLYRCLKPLWISSLDRLKKLTDHGEIKAFLDKTEHYLTTDIDFRKYME